MSSPTVSNGGGVHSNVHDFHDELADQVNTFTDQIAEALKVG
jgi:hypothetical protein